MTAVEKRAELLFLGKECHHHACHLNDFLPFSCPACHLSFCQPHFLPSQHACTSPLPPRMVDRIAPQCPLCHEVVPTLSSGDPNEAVDRHILEEKCPGLPGGEERRKAELKARKERGEACWRKGCNKSLVVKMRCESCGRSFCPTHRHTTSHICTPASSRSGTPQPSASSSAGPSDPRAIAAKAAMSRLMPQRSAAPQSTSSSSIQPLSQPPRQPVQPSPVSPSAASSSAVPPPAPPDAGAAAAAAAIKRAGQDVKLPFIKTKTEKRADAELSSTLQALKARHDRGLLSKTEEVRYAELLGRKEEGRRRSEGKGGGKDGCVVC